MSAAHPQYLSEFALEVRSGLGKDGQKELPCRYFYDEVGTALFEAITLLPEYGLTRADSRLIRRYAEELICRLPSPLSVTELGSGGGSKTRWILEILAAREPVTYYPIDISAAALAMCARELGGLGAVMPLEMPYLDGLRSVACRRRPGQSLLVLFLGSTIGNFERRAGEQFLVEMRKCLMPGDALLLGADLEKSIPEMLLAYDDPAGVTAAFNLNLLARVNRELSANFVLCNFAHEARYNQTERRIEMHLRSRVAQAVSIPDADFVFELQEGETIQTESCHKFQAGEVVEMAQRGGFHCEAQYIDATWPFAESLLIAD